MRLVERHVIKKNHRFYAEIDRLCFLSKNLYNYANYLVRQSFIFENTYRNYHDIQLFCIKVVESGLRATQYLLRKCSCVSSNSNPAFSNLSPNLSLI